MTVDPRDVTACLVTRGDVDLDPILDTLPYGALIVWDNSRRGEDMKVYGRYAAALEAATPVVYFQDDDVVFRDHEALLAAHQPGRLTSVWAHGRAPCGFDDVALVGAGALVDRDIVVRAFACYLEHFSSDAEFLYEADFVFGCLAPHTQVRLPFEIRAAAYNGRRLADQPWQRETKMRVTNRARWVRDHASGVPSTTDTVAA